LKETDFHSLSHLHLSSNNKPSEENCDLRLKSSTLTNNNTYQNADNNWLTPKGISFTYRS